MKFVPKGPINNIPALVQIMAWSRPGDKPLTEPMMVILTTHICVTRPQWVNTSRSIHNGRNLADNIFQIISLYRSCRISTQISLKYVPKGLINNKAELAQIMAWCWTSDKPLLTTLELLQSCAKPSICIYVKYLRCHMTDHHWHWWSSIFTSNPIWLWESLISHPSYPFPNVYIIRKVLLKQAKQ